jgi:hypothetical protein
MQLSGKFFAYFYGISQVGGKIGAMAFGQSSNHLNARELEIELEIQAVRKARKR